MLIILNDPAGITGIRRFQLDYSKTLQENIESRLSGGAGAELRINGEVVDPLTDQRLEKPACRFDIVTVSLRPAGIDPVTLAYIAIAAIVVASVALRPNIPNVDAAGKDSPNNKLTSQSNVARAYQAVPDVYGYRRVWPDLIQPSTVEYIDQLKYVTEWLCVSRGNGTLTDVRYAETPMTDIDGSSFEVFEPIPVNGYAERGTTTLLDVYEPFASEEVNGQELAYAQLYDVLSKVGNFTATSGATNFTIAIPDGTDLAQLKSLTPSGTAHVVFTYSPSGGGSPVTFDQTCTVQSVVVASGTATFTLSSTAWGANESGTGRTFNIEPNGTVYTTSGPYTLPVECSQLWWNTIFLRGLKGTVVIRAEWWKVDAAGVEIGGTRQSQDDSYGADTFDQRFYTTKVTPSAGFGRYRIQFQRRSLRVEANGVDVAKLEELYAVRYFATKQVPGATVLRVTTKATLSATGFSDRKFNARWARHVRQLGEGSHGESRNFARIMAHIWSVAGNDISGLDTAALQAINDEHGEDSPLLRFDGSLDDADMSLGERMALVADTARCKVWRDGTKWTATRDQAKTYPAVQFDYRNLARGGESSISYAAHLPASFDGVEIEYVDEATQAKKAYVRLAIGTGAVVVGLAANPKKIRLVGCATQEQAENRAHLEARRLLYQRVTISDKALADASDLPLGELVRWVDPNDFGGEDLQAGEVLAIAGDTITTSEPLQWGSATSGRIVFTAANGSRAAAPVACYPAGDRKVRLASVSPDIFTASTDRQCGSRYAFAVGLTSDELDAAGLYVLTESKPSSDRTVSIALANYEARMYEAD